MIEEYDVQVETEDGFTRTGRLIVSIETQDDGELLCLELELAERKFTATSTMDFFDALVKLRQELEKVALILNCNGSSRDVYPSAMSRSMGYGERAYRLKVGMPARLTDLVSIFESSPQNIPSTITEQQLYYDRWFDSL